jgi:hypothetical protein
MKNDLDSDGRDQSGSEYRTPVTALPVRRSCLTPEDQEVFDVWLWRIGIVYGVVAALLLTAICFDARGSSDHASLSTIPVIYQGAPQVDVTGLD